MPIRPAAVAWLGFFLLGPVATQSPAADDLPPDLGAGEAGPYASGMLFDGHNDLPWAAQGGRRHVALDKLDISRSA